MVEGPAGHPCGRPSPFRHGWDVAVTRWLRTRTWRLSPPGWPASRRLRIVMVSDLHAGLPQMPLSRVAEVVDRALALQGDMIVVTGDFRASLWFRQNTLTIEEVAAHLARLKAPLGVHAVLGNHDWWDDDAAQQRRAAPVHAQKVLQDAGIGVLVNRALRIGQGDAAFWLAGLDSQHAIQGARRRHEGRHDLPATLAQVADNAPVILLAHEPDIFPEVPARVSLTLSGHTHGGQIRLGPIVPVVPSRFGARYAYGHVTEGGRHLVVSGGLGCSGLPFRFGMPPEITVVDLGQGAD